MPHHKRGRTRESFDWFEGIGWGYYVDKLMRRSAAREGVLG